MRKSSSSAAAGSMNSAPEHASMVERARERRLLRSLRSSHHVRWILVGEPLPGSGCPAMTRDSGCLHLVVALGPLLRPFRGFLRRLRARCGFRDHVRNDEVRLRRRRRIARACPRSRWSSCSSCSRGKASSSGPPSRTGSTRTPRADGTRTRSTPPATARTARAPS